MIPRLQLLLAALLFSTGGVVMKGCAFDGWQIAMGRCLLATIPLVVLLPEARRRWTWRVCVVGAVYGVMLLTYVFANKTTTAASAVFLQSTAPLYLCVLAPWLLGEGLRRRDLPIMSAVAVGLAMLLAEPAQASVTAPDPWLGNWIGALSGLLWAATLLGLRWLEKRERDPGSSVRAVVAGNLILAFALMPKAFPLGEYAAVDVWLLVYLGVFQVGFAYLFVTRAVGKVPAIEASVLLLTEAVFSPLLAWWVHRENPGIWALLGGATVLGAGLVKSWLDARSEPKTWSKTWSRSTADPPPRS